MPKKPHQHKIDEFGFKELSDSMVKDHASLVNKYKSSVAPRLPQARLAD